MGAKKEDFVKNAADIWILPQITDVFGLLRMNCNLHYLGGSG